MNMPGFSFPTIFAQALTTQVKEGKPDRLCWLNVFTRVGWGVFVGVTVLHFISCQKSNWKTKKQNFPPVRCKMKSP